MEDFNQTITIFNILVSCFVSIFYISRKYIHRGKQSRHTQEIIQKINELKIGEFNINDIIIELQKILPIKIDVEQIKNNELEDIKIDII